MTRRRRPAICWLAGPPYTVYSAGYTGILGTASSADETVMLVVSHLPDDVVS